MKSTALVIALLHVGGEAFTSPSVGRTLSQHAPKTFLSSSSRPFRTAQLHMTSDDKDDDEIERLRSMAAKLRAEASKLEAEKQQELADAAERAFRKFDTNQDGQISSAELKAGLEKAFKTELPDNRVQKLMEDFDKTGDASSLSLDEFVTVDQFRNKLDALAREEKQQALDKAKAAKQEEEAAKFLQAQMDLINDGPPSAQDKILSVLPYLFPLLDGLQFARFLVIENPDNPVAGIIALLYALYRSIPFGGFIAFFALSSLSGNPRINRLVRFNMQQAIYLDIALFFPGLIAAVYSLIGNGLGFQLPPAATEVGSDVLFVTLLVTVGYSMVSSLLGITPDKIPLISDAVNNRMPTVDMFDSSGRFNPRNEKDDEKKD